MGCVGTQGLIRRRNVLQTFDQSKNLHEFKAATRRPAELISAWRIQRRFAANAGFLPMQIGIDARDHLFCVELYAQEFANRR
jgi:hypothetical protein